MPQHVGDEKPLVEDTDQHFQTVNTDAEQQIDHHLETSHRATAVWRLLSLMLVLVISWNLIYDKTDARLAYKALWSCSHSRIATESSVDSGGHALCDREYREYRRHEKTDSITGHFAWYDLLELVTETGDIDITITPQAGARAAILLLQAKTGSIRVSLASDFLSAIAAATPSRYVNGEGLSPAPTSFPSFRSSEVFDCIMSRNFSTLIHSTYGSIQADILVGNGADTHISCDHGALDLNVLTTGVSATDPPSVLHTTTQSGPQIIRLDALKPIKAEEFEITQIQSRHVSHGEHDITVWYPEQWRGRVQIAVEREGAITLTGTNLEIDVVEPEKVEAHRGYGELVDIAARAGGNVIFSAGGLE